MRDPQRSEDSSRGGSARPAVKYGSPRANAALAVTSILLTLLVIEFGFRALADEPIFSLVDWRRMRVMEFSHRAFHDPLLGWTLRAHHQSDDFNTLEHGIRRNFTETTIRTGAILAVGDSFTEGWEDVRDHETWPAHLERITGIPVVNGAVGAYGTDQIILRAEQLLPIVRPKTLIIGFFEEDIIRTGYSAFGAPKPYFTTENGELRFHPPRALKPREEPRFLTSVGDTMRIVFGYSAVADYLLNRIAPYWYTGDVDFFDTKVDNDEVAVTCALLERLKKRVDQEHIRVLLFSQHSIDRILQENEPEEDFQRVIDCAEAAGIEVIDQFASLRAVAVLDAKEFRTYFVKEGKVYEHMSSKGNEQAAKLLSAALAKPRAKQSAKRGRPTPASGY